MTECKVLLPNQMFSCLKRREWEELHSQGHQNQRIFIFNFFMFIYFLRGWERERERETKVSWGTTEREGNTEFEVGSRLWAVNTEPDTGLELTNLEIMTRAQVGHLTNWATQVSQRIFISKINLSCTISITYCKSVFYRLFCFVVNLPHW